MDNEQEVSPEPLDHVKVVQDGLKAVYDSLLVLAHEVILTNQQTAVSLISMRNNIANIERQFNER